MLIFMLASVWGDRCISPAIEQFPRAFMGQWLRQHGGFVLHVALAAYTFLALAIICDEFFVPSLERMCEVLKIQPDVAGATFMAAGSSAPELATALIGVFVAKDDIGVSGVIGSAVFNIMFVIAVCGLTTKTVLLLNWWPMVRDCFFYMLAILALLLTIQDEEIQWYESILLLLLYLVYCYAMYMNVVLEAWAHTLPFNFPVHDPTELLNQQQQLPPTEVSGLVQYTKGDGGEEEQYPPHRGGSAQSSIDLGSGSGGGGMPAGKVLPPGGSILGHFEKPGEGAGLLSWGMWRISLPLVYLLYYSVPDCRLEKWRAWYVLTFTMAMIWIALFSYVMVWMITVVGEWRGS
jgi:K+-dependent Na+/Ca+ exchanger-like protein